MIAGNAFSKHFRRFLVTAQTKSSFVPDNSRLAGQFTDETTPEPIPYPKTPRQMAVLAISSYFRVFVFSLIFFAPPRPAASYADELSGGVNVVNRRTTHRVGR